MKNNPEKFPERFSWILNDDEVLDLRSKILTANYSKMSRVNPRVFTEQGTAMLATILKTKTATKVSIAIMDAFVIMHKYISSNLIEQKFINNQVIKNTEDIKLLQESFKKFEDNKKLIDEAYFNGKIYDAYSVILQIVKKAKKELIIIDRYADKYDK